MGEKTARKIEENLKLFPGYLDIPPEKEEIFQIFDALKQVDESQYWQVMQLVQILRDGPRKQ